MVYQRIYKKEREVVIMLVSKAMTYGSTKYRKKDVDIRRYYSITEIS